MIDERDEALASRYAFDRLEGKERVDFEKALAVSPELQRLVAELRKAAVHLRDASLAAEPSVAWQEGVPNPRAFRRPELGVIAPAPTRARSSVLAWALAAVLAVTTVWLGGRFYAARAENRRLSDQRAFAKLSLKSVETQLEAERLVSAKLAADFTALKNSIGQPVASANDHAAARADSSSAPARVARDGTLAGLKIATFTSKSHETSPAVAIAVWAPAEREGMFVADQLRRSEPGQDYELWILDEQPVSAGRFTVGADGRARVSFQATAAIKPAAKFALSVEKSDAAAPAQPTHVVMLSR